MVVGDVFVYAGGEEVGHVAAACYGVAYECARYVRHRGVDQLHAGGVQALLRHGVTGARVYYHAIIVEDTLSLAPAVEDTPVVAAYDELESVVGVALMQQVKSIDSIRRPGHRQLDIAYIDAGCTLDGNV